MGAGVIPLAVDLKFLAGCCTFLRRIKMLEKFMCDGTAYIKGFESSFGPYSKFAQKSSFTCLHFYTLLGVVSFLFQRHGPNKRCFLAGTSV